MIEVSSQMKKWLLVFLTTSISCSSHAAETDLKITRDIALKAVVLFRQDPLSEEGRGAAAILVRFADKSPDVLLNLNPKSVPFMKGNAVPEKQRLTLLAAFIAGNVDSQLLRNRKGDDPYAGDLQVIETYRQMQKKNTKLHIPSVEELVDLEKRGELRRYVTTP
jgi:hypothetical protein